MAELADGSYTDTLEITTGDCIPGCMDSNALNWHPWATVDNGNCQYPPANCASGESNIVGTQSGSGVVNSMDASDNAITGVDTSYENLGDLVNITAMASGSAAAILSGSVGSGSGAVRCNVELFIASL